MAYLEYSVDDLQHTFELPVAGASIGRAEGCDLQLLHDAELSRVHCSLRKQDDDSYVLTDEQARNGTFLNGKRVVSEDAPLQDGDEIQIGKTRLRFRETRMGRTTVIFSEIEEEMKEGKGYHTIFHEIVDKKPKKGRKG